MRKILSILLLITGILILCEEINAQCDCNHKRYFVGGFSNMERSDYQTAFEELQNSPLVFIGKVKAVKRVRITGEDESYLMNRITFNVSKVWKKNIQKQIIIESSLSCHKTFEKDKEYLVYISHLENLPLVSFCSRTKKLSEAESDLAEFAEKATLSTRNILPD